jgi:hypothetical protein
MGGVFDIGLEAEPMQVVHGSGEALERLWRCDGIRL